jgi:hypothetical protein
MLAINTFYKCYVKPKNIGVFSITVQTIRNLLRKILFSVTKLFKYVTNILICNERNMYVCLHNASYIKMILI